MSEYRERKDKPHIYIDSNGHWEVTKWDDTCTHTGIGNWIAANVFALKLMREGSSECQN